MESADEWVNDQEKVHARKRPPIPLISMDLFVLFTERSPNAAYTLRTALILGTCVELPAGDSRSWYVYNSHHLSACIGTAGFFMTFSNLGVSAMA